jgi:polysaccharide biosynthesis transport protein
MSEVEYEQAAFEEATPEAPRAALGSGTTHDVNPLQVLHQLLRGRYILAIVLALGLGAGLGYLGYTIPKPVYRSSGMIRIRPFTSRILYSNERNEMMPMFDAFVDSQVLLMRSQRVTDLAMQSDEWRALKRGSSPEEASDFVRSLDVSRSEGSEIVQVSFTDLNPTAAVVGAKSVIEAYEKIYGESDVGADSRTMQVLEDRRTALTNEIKGYTDRIQMIATEFGSDALEAVYNHKVENLEKVESEWHEAQLAVTRLQPAATQPGATTQAGSTAQQAIAGSAVTQPALAAATTQKATAAATQPAALTVEEIARQDQTMQNYVSKRRSQQDEIDGMLALGLTEKAQRVQHAKSALATINKEIAEYAKSYVPPPSVAAAVAATRTMSPEEIMEEAKAKEARVHLLYDEDRTEALDLGRKWLQIKALRESSDESKQKLEDTKSRIEQLNLESEGSGRISAVSTGDRPGLPWKDDRKKFGAAGGMAGCLVGLGLTLLLGLADRRLKHSGDTTVRGLRTVNMLGVLPHMPEDILDEKGAAFAAHCVHGIRASLQVDGGAGRSMAYAITSAAAGDGKTSLVTALGMSFAASGTKTLLIDCDLIGGGLSSRLRNIARPRLSAILIGQGLVTKERWKEVSAHAKRQGCTMEEAVVELGILTREALDAAMSKQPERQPGMMDVLEDVPLSTAVQSVGVKGLSVLTLGDAEAHEVTRLSPRKLRQLVQTAKKHFDVVIVDTGPVLGSLEAQMVSGQVDGVVMVVSRGAQREMAARALDRLNAAGAKTIGFVFNRANEADANHASSASQGSIRSYRESSSGMLHRSLPAVRERYDRLGPLASAVAVSTADEAADESKG